MTPSWHKLFWKKVKVYGPNSCWPWQGAIDKGGYGRFGSQSYHQSHSFSDTGEIAAHRVCWVMHHGPIADSLHVLHKCDNPRCVNQRHLFLGTSSDNNQDKVAKGRFKSPTQKLTVEQVLLIRQLKGTATLREIAARFKVSISCVYCIYAGRSWTRLDSQGHVI